MTSGAPSSLERAAAAARRLRPPSARALVGRLDFPLRAPSTPASVTPLPAERRTGADYDTDWARRPPARWARVLVLEGVIRPSVRALADPERRGLDRLTTLSHAEQPVIFAANHHSHLDAGLLLSSLPEPWRYKVFAGAAADYFFKTRVTGAVSALALNAIPIERTKVTRRSADQAAELIDGGWSMVIFPEGGRSPDGWGQKFRGGAAYLAIRCRVPVVPVHLQGTDRILPKGSRRPRPTATVVTFGAALWPTDGEDSRRFAARLETAVAVLAEEVNRDWYSARLRAHAGQTAPLTGPLASGWRRAWALGEDRPRSGRWRTGGGTAWPEVGAR